jgi:hypothetical protein
MLSRYHLEMSRKTAENEKFSRTNNLKVQITFVGCATSAIPFIHHVITDGGREPIA